MPSQEKPSRLANVEHCGSATDLRGLFTRITKDRPLKQGGSFIAIISNRHLTADEALADLAEGQHRDYSWSVTMTREVMDFAKGTMVSLPLIVEAA